MSELLKKLDALIAETEKATPGPWKMQESGLVEIAPMVVTNGNKHKGTFVCECNEAEDGTAEKDAEFIASARTNYPAALWALKVAVEILLDVDVCAKCFPSGEYDCPEIVCYGCKAIAEIEKEFKCTNTN